MTYESETVPAENRRAWAVAVGTVLAVFAVMGWLFWDAVTAAIRVWNGSETFTHCYLILPVCLYLLYELRGELARVAPRPMPLAVIGLVPFAAAQLVGEMVGVQELEQLAIVAMGQVVLLTVLGWRVYRVAWFPFLYMFLAVPSGEWLVPTLQDFTAEFSVGALRLLNIPTLSDGIFIYIPNGSFRVAEACAGLRFLIASIAYGLLFAYMVYRSWPRRLVFVALSLIIPIVANGIRAFGIIWLAHITDNQVAIAADHVLYGWVFFALVLLLLTWIGFMFREDIEDGPLPPMTSAPTPGKASVMAASGLVAALLVAAGPAYAYYLSTHAPNTDVALAPPTVAGAWLPLSEPTYDWHISHPGADAVMTRGYEKNGAEVDVSIAFYAYQREDAELVAYNNRVFDKDVWRRASSMSGTLAPDGTLLDARGERLQRGGGELAVLSFYWVDGRFTTSRIEAKLLQLSARLFGSQPAAAEVAVATRLGEDPSQALSALADFVASIQGLEATLAATQGTE